MRIASKLGFATGMMVFGVILVLVTVPTRPVKAALLTNDLSGGLTATDLANALVGSGVTVSNATFTGANVAGGTFTGGTAGIGFDGGIILSSGAVGAVVGPNANDGSSTDSGTAGDVDLSNLAQAATFDAAVLEFDFVPTGGVLQFDYVFASEEYNEWVFQFNDVFAFYVNGTNCALVPGTFTPVTISTINNGNPYGSGGVNPEYYLNNDLDDGGGSIDTAMDGLTTVLTCTTDVNPGITNHMKLAIADASDSGLDTVVFLRGGSLEIPTITPTPTETLTPTITPTETETGTPTETPVATDTPANTATGTVTVTPTETATSTDTPTPTNTALPTDTATPTETATSTPTDTPMPTDTPANTATGTVTDTPTPTDTALPADTATPTETPTSRATSVATPTDTPTPTNTALPGNTATSTPTETVVPPTETATSTATAKPAATETPTAVPTSTSTEPPERTATPNSATATVPAGAPPACTGRETVIGVIGLDGGSVETMNGECVTFPPGTFDKDVPVTLTVVENDDVPAPPDGGEILGEAIVVDADDNTFDPPGTITFPYDPSYVVDVATLGVWVYANGEWTFLGGTVDTSAHTVSVNIVLGGMYALISRPLAEPPRSAPEGLPDAGMGPAGQSDAGLLSLLTVIAWLSGGMIVLGWRIRRT